DIEMNDPIDTDRMLSMKKELANANQPVPKKRKLDSVDQMPSSSAMAQSDDVDPSKNRAPISMKTAKRKRPHAVQSGPIVCPACDAQFTKKQSLYRHKKICT
ncbi:hypothetical protein PENTCL1PPCAC_12808, partial [Pristionchus entomophagus]